MNENKQHGWTNYWLFWLFMIYLSLMFIGIMLAQLSSRLRELIDLLKEMAQ